MDSGYPVTRYSEQSGVYMKEIQSVAVLGAGALGMMYMESLQAKMGKTAFFLAGADRLSSIGESEFTINGTPVRFSARNPLEESCSPDLILVAVKNHHLKESLPLLKAAAGPGTIVLSVLNGISSEGILEETLPESTVIYALALGMDAVRIGRDLTFTTRGRIMMNSKSNSPTEELGRTEKFLTRCGIDSIIPEDIHRELWYKWMINIGVNQVSAVTGADYGMFQKAPLLRELMDKAMKETILVAAAEGVDLKEEDIDRWHTLLQTLGPRGKTSMLQDMEAGRKTEVDSFAGDLIRKAKQQGIPVPVNETLYGIIKTKEAVMLPGG